MKIRHSLTAHQPNPPFQPTRAHRLPLGVLVPPWARAAERGR